MTEIKWGASKEDKAIIRQIVDRWQTGQKVLKKAERIDRLTMTMDIEACHLNAVPLRLADLLAADDFDFTHDVYGIHNCIDRETAQLRNHFLPRFSVREVANG